MPVRKVGIIATRLGGLDGVSLEAAKWARVLESNNIKVYNCAGEQAHRFVKTSIIPELSVNTRENRKIIRQLFDPNIPPLYLRQKIESVALKIEKEMKEWLKTRNIRRVIVNNINSLPIHVPAAIAINRLIVSRPKIKFLLHHHDFYWERPAYFKSTKLKFYFSKYFPPDKPGIFHVVINSIIQKDLHEKRGIKSVLIPNIFDRMAVEKDRYNSTFRKDIGVAEDDLILLVPCRIVPRKNIEVAIELVARIDDPKTKLVISGQDDTYDLKGHAYFKRIKKLSKGSKGRVKFIADHVGPVREKVDGKKIYSLRDMYAHSDFVIYPSSYEGWGNAFGESIAFKKPILVNRYKVFREDIEPYGFNVVKISKGKLKKDTIKEVINILIDADCREKIVEGNQKILRKHFGPDLLMKRLEPFLKR
jgi:glycosyltransferase involved in cell wall biosynthesis